jgi:hypothetical protein
MVNSVEECCGGAVTVLITIFLWCFLRTTGDAVCAKELSTRLTTQKVQKNTILNIFMVNSMSLSMAFVQIYETKSNGYLFQGAYRKFDQFVTTQQLVARLPE